MSWIRGLFPGHPAPLDPWDAEDIAAALKSPCQIVIPVSVEDELASVNQRVDSMLLGQSRPGDNDTLFRLVSDGRGGLLTAQDSKGHILLGFTTKGRAAHYAGTVGWREFQEAAFSVDRIASKADALAQLGVTGLVIDKCPYCPVFNSISASSMRDTQHVLTYWATQIALRESQFERYLAEAQHLLDQFKVSDAESLARHIVAHIDAERPEVHLLIGRCAQQRHDDATVGRKKAILRGFGPDWVKRLD